ncbi:2'-5' RNA ligase family protein [Chloroflexi bacterium CFX2]|nr:2'-5' RNA ligase family protein [Anaerolineales bacterium]MDL1945157.1 2'-5' RNA ligase family protein [Chloroflexi bacterium CFX2]
MKATLALLADSETHNLVRKLSWDIHQKYRTGIDVCRLPPHISLKQPFDISDVDSLSAYMTKLAQGLEPFPTLLTHLELIETTMDRLHTGILWLNVQETEFLRGLHERVNRELTKRFGNARAEFDGADYHFHMTVAIGGQPIETYRTILNEFKDRLMNLPCTVREMVMFVYDERTAVNAGYMTYMILRFGANHNMSF